MKDSILVGYLLVYGFRPEYVAFNTGDYPDDRTQKLYYFKNTDDIKQAIYYIKNS